MEITNENFESIFPELCQKLDECDFVSIDCEFSGITNVKVLNAFDSPKLRYDKMRKNDEKYLILQFGICLFKRQADSDKPNSYDCQAYNCFLFPRSQYAKYSKDTSFSCLNTSLEFLCEQNFDFNKVFKQGISFMSKDIEEQVRYKLNQTLEERNKPKERLYPRNAKDKEKEREQREQLDILLDEIDEFANDESEQTKEYKFSDFLLRVFVEKNIKNKYAQKIRYESKILENKERILRLFKVDAANQVSEFDILDKEIGFSKLIWQLAKSSKLIVGHNMLTDTMQIVRHFFTATLPENFEDFKSMTNSLFPKILDTKYMASVPPLKELISNTGLGNMNQVLSSDTFPKIEIINSKYNNTQDEKLHEAGYDAFLTGLCYLRMLHYLESFHSTRNALVDFYSNKIFMMKTYDIFHIDLKNGQEEPKREHVFYVEFNKRWDTQDIFELFSPYGQVFVSWINDESAFVALQNLDNVKKAAGQLIGVTGREYRVYFYQTYINQLSKNKPKSISNKPVEEMTGVENGNGKNGTNEKRKRDLPQLPMDVDTEQTVADDLKKIKKVKSIENNIDIQDVKETTEKPFEQSADWYDY